MRVIGPSQRCFIVADLGVAPADQLEPLLHAAQRAGAEAVKLRAFTPELLHAAPAEPFSPALAPRDLVVAASKARALGLRVVFSVYDLPALAHALAARVDLLKLPSGEITNRPLLEAMARAGLPLLIASGGATLPEALRALSWHQLAFRAGTLGAPQAGVVTLEDAHRVALLHGGARAPVAPEQAHLRVLTRLARRTHLPVGWVDRTTTADAAPLAVACGACLLERRLGVATAADVLDEPGFAAYVRAVRHAETLLGVSRGRAEPDALAREARRSVVAARDLSEKAILAREDLTFRRPGPGPNGVAPWDLDKVLGRPLRVALKAGEALRWEQLGGETPAEPPFFSPKP